MTPQPVVSGDHETEALQAELEQFRHEKKKIRTLVGQVGGKREAQRDKLITQVFVAALVLLFTGDVLRHLLHISIPLPPLFSLEIGILMVSLKIIWMMHRQGKVEHFQFWILNSIEFRLNDVSRQIRALEQRLERKEDE